MPAPGAFAALAATLARNLDTVRPSPSHAVLAPQAAEWWRLAQRLACLTVADGAPVAAQRAACAEAATAGLAWLTAGADQPVPVASWRDIVAVVGAVGTSAQVQQAAWTPLQVALAPRDGAQEVWQAWWRGQEARAVERAFAVSQAASARQTMLPVDAAYYEDGAVMSGLRAIAQRTPGSLRKALLAALRWHRAQYEVLPTDPRGAVSFPALLLVREAQRVGWTVSAGPYLPTQIVPGG